MRWLKAAREVIANLIHPQAQRSWMHALLPRTKVDFEDHFGDGLGSNVIMAPIFWIARAFLEARLGVVTEGKESQDLDLGHDLVNLLAKPNPFYSGKALWMASLTSWFLDGNVYWIKARDGAGRVRQLWYSPHWMIEPKFESQDFITYYQYTPGGGKEIRLNPDDVVHMRNGLDPRNVRKGLSPVRALFREIFNDDEAANFVAAMLANGGVPGVIISPKEARGTSVNDLDAVKQYIKEQFSGDKRGSPLALGAPTEVYEFGYDPEKMNLGVVRDVSEERVCAMIGIPSAVVGFGSGIEQTKVGATLAELHRIAWIDCVIPNQEMMADEISRALLVPDFGGKENQHVAWDRKQVRALEDDKNKEAERLERGVRGGWVMVSEARRAQGLDVLPEHEIFLRPIGAFETGPGAPDLPEPPVPAAPPQPVKESREAKGSLRLSRAQSQILRAMDRAKMRHEKRLVIQLKTFFVKLGAAAEDAYRQVAKADDDELRIEAMYSTMNIPRFQSELRGIMGAHFVSVHRDTVGIIAGMGIGVELPDAVELEILARGGTQAVDLKETSRDKALNVVREARAEGQGIDEIARRLGEAVPAGRFTDSRIRAELIARTETRVAQTESALRCYESAEGITQVAIIDGRLGPTDSDCERANGRIVDFNTAQGMIADEHPNGTRDLVPVFG